MDKILRGFFMIKENEIFIMLIRHPTNHNVGGFHHRRKLSTAPLSLRESISMPTSSFPDRLLELKDACALPEAAYSVHLQPHRNLRSYTNKMSDLRRGASILCA